MGYQVLARKYRPQRFSDVIGQDHVTRTLANALEQGRIAHGYIFSGHRGIGKTTIARILAMALNCRNAIGSPERPNFEPCGVCESCEEIRAGNAVDVIEIDAATNRGIDEIRELRDAARYRPSRDRYKIYILDEAHQITDAAFNALLKTLEEPPDHVIFMMATTQPEDILQTIRSRCQHYSFHAVRFDEILQHLRAIATDENVQAEDEALALLAEAGDGSMRDALSIMDQAIAAAPVENGQTKLEAAPIRALMGTVPNAVFARLLEAVSENSSAAVLTELDRLLNAGNSAVQLARQFVRYLRNVLMARIDGEQTQLLQLSPDERARAAGSAMLFGEEEIMRFLQIMLRAANELTYRQEQRFHLELAVLKLVHLQRLLPVEEILSQLSGASPAHTVTASSSALSTAPQPMPSSPLRSARQVQPARAAAPASSAPAFSPFERDAERKHTPLAHSATPTAMMEPPPPPAPAKTAQEAEPVRPLEAAPQEVAPQTVTGPQAAAIPEPVRPEQAALPVASTTLDLDGMRNAACDALAAAGHATAATLIGAGTWTETPEAIVVEVAAKKVMLGLTMNADADKIARAAMRPFAGQPLRAVQWVPSENGSRQKTAARPAPIGSVQAAALDNPLVQQAKQLFSAEVRNVVDLRDKR
jgi:DNA polymerase-3 subunit gamma/tau